MPPSKPEASRELTYAQAVNEALAEEMRRNAESYLKALVIS